MAGRRRGHPPGTRPSPRKEPPLTRAAEGRGAGIRAECRGDRARPALGAVPGTEAESRPAQVAKADALRRTRAGCKGWTAPTWNDNMEAVARAVCAKRPADDDIGEDWMRRHPECRAAWKSAYAGDGVGAAGATGLPDCCGIAAGDAGRSGGQAEVIGSPGGWRAPTTVITAAGRLHSRADSPRMRRPICQTGWR